MNVKLKDSGQKFWQLAMIQGASFGGIPVLMLGGIFATNYGIKSAILTIFIANILLWLIGLAIVGMSSTTRSNAVQNFEHYLGKFSASAGALFLIVSFILWFGVQLQVCTEQLKPLLLFFSFPSSSTSLRIGASLGFFVAILSLKGIKLIMGLHYILILFNVLNYR